MPDQLSDEQFEQELRRRRSRRDRIMLLVGALLLAGGLALAAFGWSRVDTATPLEVQERQGTGHRRDNPARKTRGGGVFMIVGLGLAGTGLVTAILGGVRLRRARAQR